MSSTFEFCALGACCLILGVQAVARSLISSTAEANKSQSNEMWFKCLCMGSFIAALSIQSSKIL